MLLHSLNKENKGKIKNRQKKRKIPYLFIKLTSIVFVFLISKPCTSFSCVGFNSILSIGPSSLLVHFPRMSSTTLLVLSNFTVLLYYSLSISHSLFFLFCYDLGPRVRTKDHFLY